MPPFLIGQCCTDQVITADPVNPDASGKNEIVPFSNVATITLAWNNTRKNRFGDAAVIVVEIKGDDGKYRQTSVEVVPNSALNTTSYAIDLGGLSSGRLIIS
jgi:hypothetical protein